MATNISKVSNVLFVTDGTNQPRAFFNSSGSYEVNDAADGVRISIYFGQNQRQEYAITLANLQVNGQTPANITVAKVLLNAVFGS